MELAPAALPVTEQTEAPARPVLLEVAALHKHYPIGGGWLKRRIVRALDGASFTIEEGKTLGLVGESGCGKSTLARVLLQLEPATSGSVTFGGEDLTQAGATRLRQLRRDMQMVFQDPYGSIDSH